MVLILHILVKTRYTLPLSILLIVIITFNAYFSFVFSTGSIGLGIVASFWETDYNEASSVLSGRIFSILAILSITTLLVLLAQRELKNIKIKRRVSLIIVLIYSCCILPMFTYRRVLLTELRFHYHKASLYYAQIVVNEYAPLVYGNIITLASYFNEINSFKQAFESERVLKQGMTNELVSADSVLVNKIYLVIGESVTRKHMSLYGYDVQTTPFIDSLFYSDSLDVAYYNALAAATFTRNAVPMILTSSTPHDRTAFSKEKTILDLANDAGYDTYWLSNHRQIDAWDIQLGESYVARVASMAKNIKYTSTAYGEDFEIVSMLQEIQAKNSSNPQLFVLHLAGSHDRYLDRYDEIDEAVIEGEGLVAEYDRSIHHTDRVLRKLYDIMKNDESSMLIYMPDHGEDIGFSHGFTMGVSQFQVPLITINNSTLSLDSVVGKYLDNQSSKDRIESDINLGSVMYVVSEILGYTVSDELLKQVIDDGRYVYHRDRAFPYKEIFDEEQN